MLYLFTCTAVVLIGLSQTIQFNIRVVYNDLRMRLFHSIFFVCRWFCLFGENLSVRIHYTAAKFSTITTRIDDCLEKCERCYRRQLLTIENNHWIILMLTRTLTKTKQNDNTVV